MKLSKRQTQLAHAALIGFVTGGLAAVQIAVTSGLTEKKAIVAFAIGVFWAGISRAAGAVLNVVQTTDAPPASPPDVVIQADRAPPRDPGS